MTDDHDPEVVPVAELLEEHVGAFGPGHVQGRSQLGGVGDTDRDAPTLFAPRRLDHHVPHLGEEVGVVVGGSGVLASGYLQAGPGQDAAGHPFVVAAAHGHRAGELGERFAGDHPAATVGEAHLSPGGVEDLHGDAPPARLVGDDAGVGVELLVALGQRGGEQRLVDRVLALDAEHRDLLEAELLVEADGGHVVVKDGEVEVGPAPGLVLLGQGAHQRLAQSGKGGPGVHGQAPQTRAVFGVGEGPHVVDAGDGAHHLVGDGVGGHQIGEGAGALIVPEHLRRGRHHPAGGVQAVDGGGIAQAVHIAHDHAEGPQPSGPVAVEPQPVRIRRIDEQFVGGEAHQHVGVVGVQADVTPAGLFCPQHLLQSGVPGERLAEDQPTPPALQRHVGFHADREVPGRPSPHGRQRRGPGQGGSVLDHVGHQIPCSWSQSSSSPSCQSLLPRRGVSSSLGAAWPW